MTVRRRPWYVLAASMALSTVVLLIIGDDLALGAFAMMTIAIVKGAEERRGECANRGHVSPNRAMLGHLRTELVAIARPLASARSFD